MPAAAAAEEGGGDSPIPIRIGEGPSFFLLLPFRLNFPLAWRGEEKEAGLNFNGEKGKEVRRRTVVLNLWGCDLKLRREAHPNESREVSC